jgi:hypothetical protein
LPRSGVLDKSGTDRVEMHVPRDGPEIGLVFHQFGPVTALENVSAETMPASPSVRVCGKKSLHSFGKVRLGRLQDYVKVVRHDDECENPPRASDRRPS